ncbi:hypothetical protein CTEN210_12019 [Chaetoceros tenuissimus]|uniref:VWFA domain-containing protein n=1 Tax=Chaetoceros tenuissimus TaxID=426638 RepID=A0AAD3D0Q0_9STRA|nr:hypothetical protein CTEN210_12019 [Chaetoceros tenuissimus]
MSLRWIAKSHVFVAFEVLLISIGLFIGQVNAFQSSNYYKTSSHRLLERLTRSSRLNILSSPTLEEPVMSIDPLLINAIESQQETNVFQNGVNIASTSLGIQIWRSCLSKGRYPTVLDFEHDTWPTPPLYEKFIHVMSELELPRFVSKHPETLSSVLLTVIKLTFQYMATVNEYLEEQMEEEQDDYFDEYDLFQDYTEYEEEEPVQDENENEITLSDAQLESIAQDVANELQNKWKDVVTGVTLLDEMFGYDHGLLDVFAQDDGDGLGGSTLGFGIEDGIWKNSGWKEIPALQKQISSMHELKDLMNNIGRRPTAENSNEIRKFAPRKLQKDGSMGAQFDPSSKESISGITRSSNLAEMLPSEAVGLRVKVDGSNSSKALRRLFLAKMAESKLLSYERSGWEDVPSVPQTRPLYQKRMPSATGGPIIICLDTSYSMTGSRETLSKAVVLACVTMAHKQQRDCQVVAFSTERGVIEAGIITKDAEGVRRLLSFLSNSFGGGTDVTGALKFAMDSLNSEIMAAADILLISDGEIPDPPVSEKVMEKLERLKLSKGVEIHGLIVGKKESKPLSKLCTEVHDFLLNYDIETSLLESRGLPMNLRSNSALYSSKSSSRLGFGSRNYSQRKKATFTLRAKFSDYDEGTGRKGKKKGKKKRSSKWDDEKDDYDDFVNVDSIYSGTPNDLTDDFGAEVENSINEIHRRIENEIRNSKWTSAALEAEREAKGSCWTYRHNLIAAIESVSEGLVERQEEASLVLLAMLAEEHILLLGVPGTGKSVLGRRLSNLCDGEFFNRLLTKFSTPEELFGPLSLKSLENDEYKRITKGYLPTADIAFLDEIFKANSAILNTLLTILNERKFTNGDEDCECPIRCVVGASNELPESDELVALYDRFLIRKEVSRVSDEAVLELLTMSNPHCNVASDESCEVSQYEIGSIDEIISNLSKASEQVHLSRSIALIMKDLRTYMREEHSVDISDRRLVKAARLLKISAASHGRQSVDPIDCLLLQHCMWHLPEQKSIVKDWLLSHLTPGQEVAQLRLLLDTLRSEAIDVLRRTSGDINGEAGARDDDLASIASLKTELDQISEVWKGQQSDLLRHIELLDESESYLWCDSNEVKSICQSLLPKARKALDEVVIGLLDCQSFLYCLEGENDEPSNDQRVSVLEALWEEGYSPNAVFSEEEMALDMREAKKRYDIDTFRKWKRAKKKLDG